MKSIIYVPQGRSARLTMLSSVYDIEGLYTDKYSTCQIIASIGKEKLSLIHLDRQMLHHFLKIKEEIEWVGENNEIIIISRQQGKELLETLLDSFKRIMPSANPIIKQVDDNYDGILLSFANQNDNDIHPQIQKYPISRNPDNLLHHPQEQSFLADQKIEQVIGIRATMLTRKARTKQPCIFDGIAWERLEDYHSLINTEHSLTQDEMNIFSKNDAYIEICNKFEIIHKQNIIYDSSINTLESKDYQEIAFHLQGYLNEFNSERMFKRDMMHTLIDLAKDHQVLNPISTEDKLLKQKILALFKKESIVFEKIHDFVNQYRENSPKNIFKQSFLKQYSVIASKYQDRKYYDDLASQRVQKLESAKKGATIAIKAYQEKDYAAATNLFFDIIKQYSHYSMKNSTDFAAVYYNYGRSLYQLGKFEEAEIALDTSLHLRKNYADNKPVLSDIEKTEKALKECRQKITELIKETKLEPALIYTKN